MATAVERCEAISALMNKIEKKIKPMLKCGLEKDCLQGDGEVIGVLFVLPKEVDKVKEKVEELFPEEPSIVVFPIGISKFIEKFVNRWRTERRLDIKVGTEIKELKGSGIAIYINWPTKTIIRHRYKNGAFLTRQCKKTSLWKTSHGIWIIGFATEAEAEEFAKNLQKELLDEFNKNFRIDRHEICFEKENKQEAEGAQL